MKSRVEFPLAKNDGGSASRPLTNPVSYACYIKHCLATKHFTVWTPCLVLFDRIWSCLINFEGHQTFDQKRKRFLLFARLMGDVLFVWTAAFQTCLMRACVPRLLSGLYQLFHLFLIKHVLTVWPLTSTLACLARHQTMFDGVWLPNIYRLSRP